MIDLIANRFDPYDYGVPQFEGMEEGEDSYSFNLIINTHPVGPFEGRLGDVIGEILDTLRVDGIYSDTITYRFGGDEEDGEDLGEDLRKELETEVTKEAGKRGITLTWTP